MSQLRSVGRRKNRCERCPWCERPYILSNTNSRRKSVDHIIPRARGGFKTWLWSGYGEGICPAVRNFRIMCQGCNSGIARLGGCIGALACELAFRTVATHPDAADQAGTKRTGAPHG